MTHLALGGFIGREALLLLRWLDYVVLLVRWWTLLTGVEGGGKELFFGGHLRDSAPILLRHLLCLTLAIFIKIVRFIMFAVLLNVHVLLYRLLERSYCLDIHRGTCNLSVLVAWVGFLYLAANMRRVRMARITRGNCLMVWVVLL